MAVEARVRRDSKEDKAVADEGREGVRLAVVAILVVTAVVTTLAVAQRVVGESDA